MTYAENMAPSFKDLNLNIRYDSWRCRNTRTRYQSSIFKAAYIPLAVDDFGCYIFSKPSIKSLFAKTTDALKEITADRLPASDL